ncbi:MAG: OsmC family protein [Gemmatimonadota bacterium]|nr:OsmC family protein [Gemmatimonadota bacterium]
MAVSMTGEYTGGLKMRLVHGPSGADLRTAAPLDNQGDGSSFSPTDLVAAALGACMITTMAIVAEREGIPFAAGGFEAEKHMRSTPRRIDRIPVRIHLPPGLDPEQRATLQRAALGCPVHASLHPEVRIDLEFVEGEG